MQRYTIKDARAMTRDFVADYQPSRDHKHQDISNNIVVVLKFRHAVIVVVLKFRHAVVHIILTRQQY